MKAGIGKIPFVGAACHAAGFIFVNHTSPRAALHSIAEAKRQLRDGASLVIFPEGSRTTDGKMGRFHKGAFRLALDQQLPIVPITLNGPFKVLPVGSLQAHPHRMEMVIHSPVPIDEQTLAEKGNQQMLANRTREIISASLWDEFKGQ